MEHRLSPRMATDFSAVVKMGDRKVRCRVKNVNADGMYIQASLKDVRLHMPLQVTVENKYGPLHMIYSAMIVRLDERGIGLMFTETRSTLLEYDLDISAANHAREMTDYSSGRAYAGSRAQ